LPSTESRLVGDLLGSDREFTFKSAEHARVAAALKAHKTALREDYGRTHFRLNSGLTLVGMLISIVALMIATACIGDTERSGSLAFILIWLGVWSIGVFALGAKVVAAWREARRGRGGKRLASAGGATFLTVFALPFAIGEVAGIVMLAMAAGVLFALVFFALIAVNALFAHLLKAPTATGRRLLDQIDGLRLYLGVAERDELAAQKGPPVDTERYQRMLPYALALGVEENWTNRFAATVGPAVAAATVATAGWYHGHSVDNLGSFASGLGDSFGSAISSSSSAPGSSSGSGGGGSSGGGGGGGGGGGW